MCIRDRRKALGYLAPDAPNHKGPLIKAQGRPARYTIRAPKLNENGLSRAARNIRDRCASHYRVRASELKGSKWTTRYGRGFDFKRALTNMIEFRAQEAENARLEVEDDVFYCAAC